MLNKPKYIIIHCTDVSYKVLRDQFSSVNTYHKNKWGSKSSLGYYVGYHRLITGGKNYHARKDSDVGVHCNTVVDGVSMNFQSLGICLGFDGDIEYPPQPDLDLCIAQIIDWMDEYSIPLDKVVTHAMYSNDGKTCPGSLLNAEYFRNLIKAKVLPSPKPLDQQKKQLEIERQISIRQKLVKLLQELLRLTS